MKGSLWYRKGLRFECTQCGACCTGNSGLVEFDEDESEAMAEHLGISEDEFLQTYASYFDGQWYLKEVDPPAGEPGVDCIFLVREEGRMLCDVHPVRPTQCRTWPFWGDNLRSRGRWEKAAQSCEGIGRGRTVPLHEIERQRRATERTGARARDEF